MRKQMKWPVGPIIGAVIGVLVAAWLGFDPGILLEALRGDS